MIIARYSNLLEKPKNKKIRASHCAGFFSGFGTGSRVLYMGLSIFLGLEIVVKKWNIDIFIVIAAALICNFSFLQVGDQAT